MTRTTSPVTEWGERLAAWIDRDHPRVARFLLGLRWGGLRTVEPSPATFAAVLGGGAVLGEVAARRWRLRSRVPVAGRGAGPLAAALAWTALWRWDARRWRDRNVRLVPGLPPDAVRALVEDLAGRGFDVEPWVTDGPGGPQVGLRCRTRDLRRVNTAIGEASADVAGRDPRPPRTG